MTEKEFQSTVDGALAARYYDGSSHWERHPDGNRFVLGVVRRDEFFYPRYANSFEFSEEHFHKQAHEYLSRLMIDLFQGRE